MRDAEISDERARRGDDGKVGVVAFVGSEEGRRDRVLRRDGEGWWRV